MENKIKIEEEKIHEIKIKKGILGSFSKILVILILCAELSLAFLIPFALKSGNIFSRELTLQRTNKLLEDLKRAYRTTGKYANKRIVAKNALIKSLKALILKDLNMKEKFIKENPETISKEQLQQYYKELIIYKKLMKKLKTNTYFDKLPDISSDDIIESILKQ